MRWKAGTAGLVAVLALTAAMGFAQGQDDTVTTLVMFDLGDGSVFWQEAVLAENRTAIKATEVALPLGLNLEVTWFEFGAFVTDIGDREPVFPEWFHLLLWKPSSLAWELSPLGASDLSLEEGDIIGWFLSADDPTWDGVGPWPGPKPLANPFHPFPMVTFRADRANHGFLATPAPETPGLAWRFDAGGAEIGASTVGARGVGYQVTWNGTHALNLATGRLLWENDRVAGLSTPALLHGDLIAGSRDGRLYRLRGDTGQVVWSVPLQGATQFTGIASSPKVSHGRAFVGTFNESGGPGRLVAVDVEDGSLAWATETSSIHMSAPAVRRGAVYVGVMGRFSGSEAAWDPPYGLLSVQEEDGARRWFYTTAGPVASSPAVEYSTVYFTSRDGFLYAVSDEGSLRWRTEIGPSTSSPAVWEGHVFAASGVLGTEGRVGAFTLDGRRLWEFVPNGPVQSSLILADGLLLFATNTERGTIYALDALSGDLVWTYTPQPLQYILPSPAVIDGVVVIGSDNGFVYALERAEEPPGVPGDLVLAAVGASLAGAVILTVAIVLYIRRVRAP